MTFVPKNWQDAPSTATPINAAALVDLEQRLAVYVQQTLPPNVYYASAVTPGGGDQSAVILSEWNNAYSLGYTDFMLPTGRINIGLGVSLDPTKPMRLRGAAPPVRRQFDSGSTERGTWLITSTGNVGVTAISLDNSSGPHNVYGWSFQDLNFELGTKITTGIALSNISQCQIRNLHAYGSSSVTALATMITGNGANGYGGHDCSWNSIRDCTGQNVMLVSTSGTSCNYWTVENCNVVNSVGKAPWGIQLGHGTQPMISNCMVQGYDKGINIIGARGPLISNVAGENNNAAIYLDTCRDGIVHASSFASTGSCSAYDSDGQNNLWIGFNNGPNSGHLNFQGNYVIWLGATEGSQIISATHGMPFNTYSPSTMIPLQGSSTPWYAGQTIPLGDEIDRFAVAGLTVEYWDGAAWQPWNPTNTNALCANTADAITVNAAHSRFRVRNTTSLNSSGTGILSVRWSMGFAAYPFPVYVRTYLSDQTTVVETYQMQVDTSTVSGFTQTIAGGHSAAFVEVEFQTGLTGSNTGTVSRVSLIGASPGVSSGSGRTTRVGVSPESLLTGSVGDIAYNVNAGWYEKRTGTATTTGWRKVAVEGAAPISSTLVAASKAGIPADSDYAVTPDVGAIALNTSGSSLWGRTASATWKNISLPPGWANVQDYGAVGSGSGDDSTAIQNAINSGAHTIYFPYTTNGYKILTGLVLPSSSSAKQNLKLVGDSGPGVAFNLGYGGSRIKVGPGIIGFLGQVTGVAQFSGITLENLHFQDNNPSTTLTGSVTPSGGATVPVQNIAFFPAAPSTFVLNGETISYTGISGNSFTGCTGGTIAAVAGDVARGMNPALGGAQIIGINECRIKNCTFSDFATENTQIRSTSTGGNTDRVLNDTNQAWTTNQFAGMMLNIISGTGAGQQASIVSNTATSITVTSNTNGSTNVGAFTTVPDATSVYAVTNPQFGLMLGSSTGLYTQYANVVDCVFGSNIRSYVQGGESGGHILRDCLFETNQNVTNGYRKRAINIHVPYGTVNHGEMTINSCRIHGAERGALIESQGSQFPAQANVFTSCRFESCKTNVENWGYEISLIGNHHTNTSLSTGTVLLMQPGSRQGLFIPNEVQGFSSNSGLVDNSGYANGGVTMIHPQSDGGATALIPAGLKSQFLQPTGVGGATNTTRWIGANASGAPSSGTFQTGDIAVDRSTGTFWFCTASGTPGTWTPTARVSDVYKATGLTGATAQSRYAGGTNSGAPVSGTFSLGDFVVDQTGSIWVCTASGSPGTWASSGASITSVFGRSGVVTAQSGDYTAAQVTNAADKSSGSTQAFTGALTAPSLSSNGLTGATAASRYVGATASGAPVAGTFLKGDFVVDQTGGTWVCTVAGTPGTWSSGGSSAVSSVFTRSGAVTAQSGDYTAAQVTNAADKSSGSAQNFTSNVQAPALIPSGLTGATAAYRIVGATTAGPPVSGTFVLGDFIRDQAGFGWLCTAGGTPGTWIMVGATLSGTESAIPAASASNAGACYFATDSSALYRSNGSSWQFMTTGDPGYFRNGSQHVRETFPRETQLSSDSNAAASSTVKAVPITLYRGDVITNLSIFVGATPATSPTHWWLALYDTQSTPALIAQTADQGNAAMAATTAYTKALSSPYTVTTSGVYWVAVSVTAGTVPSLYGKASTGSSQLATVTGQKTNGVTFGSAVNGTAPATITGATSTATIPYIATS